MHILKKAKTKMKERKGIKIDEWQRVKIDRQTDASVNVAGCFTKNAYFNKKRVHSQESTKIVFCTFFKKN